MEQQYYITYFASCKQTLSDFSMYYEIADFTNNKRDDEMKRITSNLNEKFDKYFHVPKARQCFCDRDQHKQKIFTEKKMFKTHEEIEKYTERYLKYIILEFYRNIHYSGIEQPNLIKWSCFRRVSKIKISLLDVEFEFKPYYSSYTPLFYSEILQNLSNDLSNDHCWLCPTLKNKFPIRFSFNYHHFFKIIETHVFTDE